MNLPNKLTIFRIILVPIMVIISYLEISGQIIGVPIKNWLILIIFSVASITDSFDGMIARKNNLVTSFGKFADPLADKILVLSAMLILLESGKIPAWIPIIVIAREFLVLGYRLVAVSKSGEVIAANIWGKIKTVTQMIGIILMFLDNYSFGTFIKVINNCKNGIICMTSFEIGLNILSTFVLILSVIATIFSGWSYMKNSKELLKD